MDDNYLDRIQKNLKLLNIFPADYIIGFESVFGKKWRDFVCQIWNGASWVWLVGW